MKILFTLIFCAAAVSAKRQFPLATLLENQSHDDSRIIQGTPAKLGEFPHQVGIYFETNDGGHKCGGTLISSNWVLTAAHCAAGAKLFDLFFGSINYQQGTLRQVDKFIVHERYNPNNLNNDVALLHFADPIVESSTIKIAKLPARGQTIGANVQLFVSGWGRISDTTDTNSLYYTNVVSISNSDCEQYFGGSIIASTLCCNGFYTGQSTCKGDSGGPLGYFDSSDNRFVLVGVVSFVHISGCQNNYPFGFVRTESMLDWISQNMQ